MKLILILFLFLQAHSICAQLSNPKISFGILFSDVKSDMDGDIYNYGNTWKRGCWGTISTDYKIWKWVHFEGGFTYQERKALEVFLFPAGDSIKQTSALNFREWAFVNYPTSPQSKGYDDPVNKFKHFPNFKYLNLELIPLFKWSKKWELGVGVGLFGGILLNKNEVTVGQEDLPLSKWAFEPPWNVYGEVWYHRYDFGWVPKFFFSFPLGKKLNLEITAKSYYSLLRMNDTFVWPSDWSNNNVHWKTHFVGLGFQYKFWK